VKQIKAEEKSTAVPNFDPEFLARARYENNMVRKAERLDGNLGYLKLDLFIDVRISKPTLVAAMNFLHNSDGLIIDLRKNGGGNASTVNFLLNYFLPDSTLTSQFKSRLTKMTTDIYTEYDPAIQKFSNNIPLYILVSKRTSSAAEAFAYTLQSFKRATIMGDTTNGEANPGYAFVLNSDMFIMIPTSVNKNVITHTNWQGVGVVPDILISSSKALDAAQGNAYKELGKSAKDTKLKAMYDWLSTGYSAKAFPVTVPENVLKSFTGDYENSRKITLDQKELFYERAGGSERKKLLPVTPEIFELEGSAFFRVRFIKNKNGETIALEAMYDDGEREISKRL
ncbi:MAG TPA: S41 family peptidase, partial [Ferruginibacter sp.]|nr:S41 family peptidase [Ferruginibacter sp.]